MKIGAVALRKLHQLFGRSHPVIELARLAGPECYYSWGVALAQQGDLDAATAKLQVANLKGPHWADPLKAWGDVLLKQGHTKEALAKYDAALKYAPNWQQLKDARDALMNQKT
jgi:tetratricopeptide (TPR) repeat protein